MASVAAAGAAATGWLDAPSGSPVAPRPAAAIDGVVAADDTRDRWTPGPDQEPPADGGGLLHGADRRLAALALAGDPAGVAELITRLQCVPRFAAVCNRSLGGHLDRQGLEDVVQDVLATVWAKLAEFRGDASLDTWSFRITDLTVRNAVRKVQKRRSAAEVPELGAPNPGLAGVDAAEQVAVAMANLPPEEAIVLRLKHYEELTFDEIGRTLGLSPNTVKTRYYRALTTMREQMQNDGKQS